MVRTGLQGRRLDHDLRVHGKESRDAKDVAVARDAHVLSPHFPTLQLSRIRILDLRIRDDFLVDQLRNRVAAVDVDGIDLLGY